MKQTKFLAFLLFAGMTLVACEDDDEYEFVQPVDNTQTVTFEENSWNALIDNPQYYGPLLYGDNAASYAWTDNATQLHGGMSNTWGGYYGYSEGGIAISNYIDGNYNTERSFDIQLAVPSSNGSRNFAVVYCEADLTFADGVARVVKSMDLIGTTYALSICKNGNAYARALNAPDDYLILAVTAYNGSAELGTTRICLAKKGFLLDKWYSHSFNRFGKVTRLHFSMEGSDESYGYLNTPAYVAIDNVVVEK